jgi:hypothetical protein
MNELSHSPQAGEILAANPDVLAIKVEDETIVYQMTAGRFFGLRGGAELIWQKIAAGTDHESTIIEEIAAEHGGDEAHIRADIAKAIGQMKQWGILVGG